MTLIEINAAIRKANRLFARSARAAERGSGACSEAQSKRYEAAELGCAAQAEALLKPFGITCYYPGLYPAFKVGDHQHHDLESAVSDAISIQIKSHE